jgi:hypothetical protein
MGTEKTTKKPRVAESIVAGRDRWPNALATVKSTRRGFHLSATEDHDVLDISIPRTLDAASSTQRRWVPAFAGTTSHSLGFRGG